MSDASSLNEHDAGHGMGLACLAMLTRCPTSPNPPNDSFTNPPKTAVNLSAVCDAHRILVMERGQIVEQGSHAELLSHQAGHYSRLHRLQQG